MDMISVCESNLAGCFDRGASALEVVNHLCLSILQDQGYALVLMS
jgi:hypothetical protein